MAISKSSCPFIPRYLCVQDSCERYVEHFRGWTSRRIREECIAFRSYIFLASRSVNIFSFPESLLSFTPSCFLSPRLVSPRSNGRSCRGIARVLIAQIAPSYFKVKFTRVQLAFHPIVLLRVATKVTSTFIYITIIVDALNCGMIDNFLSLKL